jgi:hypothetical protein
MVRLIPFPEYEHDPPGPAWEPVIYDGSFPHMPGEEGDIYVNRYRDPPLYYFFNKRGNCELVSREEIRGWVTGGLMKLPTPAPEKNRPSRKPLTPLVEPGQEST